MLCEQTPPIPAYPPGARSTAIWRFAPGERNRPTFLLLIWLRSLLALFRPGRATAAGPLFGFDSGCLFGGLRGCLLAGCLLGRLDPGCLLFLLDRPTLLAELRRLARDQALAVGDDIVDCQ